MHLKAWMRSEGLSDAAMAERIGEISAFMVRKLRFRVRGPSVRVAARIEAITGGEVRAADMLPKRADRRRPSAAAGTPAEAGT